MVGWLKALRPASSNADGGFLGMAAGHFSSSGKSVSLDGITPSLGLYLPYILAHVNRFASECTLCHLIEIAEYLREYEYSSKEVR